MFKSIAIDGPAGAGKSTISKILANKIKFDYLDTGAMYRAFTYYYLKNNINIEDIDEIEKFIEKINFKILDGVFYLDGINVEKEIRSNIVTKNVSKVSSYKIVRDKLVQMQRDIAKKSNIVLDGRDIGTEVLKDASIKFYLTASPEVRAMRRYLENQKSIPYEKVLEDINMRDYFDSNREVSPLRKAEDAILIDSSNLNLKEVVNLLITILEKKNVI